MMRSISSCADIPKDHPIYIYGTGNAGRNILSKMIANGYADVQGFVDSYAQGFVGALPILDPLKNQDELKDATILIASQSWTDIGRRLSDLGYQYIYNAYPIYTNNSVGRLTVDHGFLERSQIDDLCDLIARTPEAGRLAVIGHNGSAAELVTALRDSAVSARVSGWWDTGLPGESETHFPISTLYRRHRDGAFKTLIVAVGAIDFRMVVRRLRRIMGIDAPLWAPAKHLQSLSIKWTGKSLGAGLIEIRNELNELHGDPLLVVVPPCAGTMRFQPQIENLLGLLGWAAKTHVPLTTNPFFFRKFLNDIGRSVNPNEDPICDNYKKNNTDSYFWFSKSLRYYDYMIIHDHSLDLSRFSEIDFKSVVLMRDPRDIINSYFYRVYPWNDPSCSAEEFMLDLLDGQMEFVTPEAGYRWASAKEWTDSYLAAMESPNMEIVRFEDLHRDEIGTLRDILARLELTPNPFVEITDTVLRSAARLGSFEHQTNGQAVRGEDRQGIVGQTSCRKGVVGDWRSTFTPAVVEKFKRLTGDALIRLGYEDSMDWGLDASRTP